VTFLLETTFLILLPIFQGKNLIHLIDRPDGPYCFRLQKDRVYYVSEESMRLSISVARPNLVSLGTCFGKFSKSGKFKLHITSLDYISKYAKYKVCNAVHSASATCITHL
jgi:ribosome biogenesis protein Nip4